MPWLTSCSAAMQAVPVPGAVPLVPLLWMLRFHPIFCWSTHKRVHPWAHGLEAPHSTLKRRKRFPRKEI